jgi:hypothetical protein
MLAHVLSAFPILVKRLIEFFATDEAEDDLCLPIG